MTRAADPLRGTAILSRSDAVQPSPAASQPYAGPTPDDGYRSDKACSERDHVMATAAYTFLAVGVIWTVAVAFITAWKPDPIAAVPVGLSALVALAVAPRLNRPRRRRPWTLLTMGAVMFGLRIVLAPAQLGETGSLPVIPMAAAVVGYVFVVASAASFLWDHRDHDRASLTDSLLIASGAVAPIVVFLIVPAIAEAGQSTLAAVEAGLFPLFDLMLCYLLSRLMLAMPTRPPAMKLLVLTALMVLIGDLAWGLVAAETIDLPMATLEIPYTFGFITVGAAALHPSMRLLTVPTVRRIRPLRSGRLTVIAAALMAPALVVAIATLQTLVQRLTVASSIAIGALIAAHRARRAIDQHAANEQRLAFMATHDVLTTLPNRRLALERIQIALTAAANDRDARVAALFVDVDRFKLINDTWGHPVGDELLVAAATRLRACIDDRILLAHVSGDEFLIVGTGGDQHFAESLAKRVLDCFGKPFALSNGEVIVSVSVGVAIASPALVAVTRDELVRNADIALYRAKARGRNRFEVFDASMLRSVSERYALERDLRLAVERDEFTVHYQPIADIRSGTVQGFEALLRWDRPGHGHMPPHAFVPVLEELDLIVDVGRFVLEEALTQLATWQRSGLDLYVSINIAARQIHGGGLVGAVGRLLDESGVQPGALMLELTESLLIEESPVVRETMDGLALLGVQLAIDDFGTGHSSLQYLIRFPVSAVKVDRSFVQALGHDTDSATIVQAVVGMSHALGLTVIAEGVETPAQRAHVARLGCDAVQGFAEGRPDDAASISLDSAIAGVLPATRPRTAPMRSTAADRSA